MLTILEHIPDELLACEATDLHRVLPGPTLVHLTGRQREPVFVSVLLHGNEPTGFQAIQQLLQKYSQQTLPRALSIFFGNISAAREGQRHLDGQPDYNRIWPHANSGGGSAELSAERRMMRDIVAIMRDKQVFASIDVHNNTGLNPHYGCINRLDKNFLHLATLFSRTVVYFIRPEGVQSMAFAELCPAITVECGKPDQPHGVAHAMQFIDTCLHLSHFPEHDVLPQDIDLFHTVATVSVPEQLSISFQQGSGDVCLLEDLDHLNFRELPTNTSLGRMRDGLAQPPLVVVDEQGKEVTERYFSFTQNHIQTNRPVMPSMFTLDVEVIRQDCLGYLMERMPLNP